MKLTADKVYSTMLTLFPSQNDFSKSDYQEELKELLDFGVDTVNIPDTSDPPIPGITSPMYSGNSLTHLFRESSDPGIPGMV